MSFTIVFVFKIFFPYLMFVRLNSVSCHFTYCYFYYAQSPIVKGKPKLIRLPNLKLNGPLGPKLKPHILFLLCMNAKKPKPYVSAFPPTPPTCMNAMHVLSSHLFAHYATTYVLHCRTPLIPMLLHTHSR